MSGWTKVHPDEEGGILTVRGFRAKIGGTCRPAYRPVEDDSAIRVEVEHAAVLFGVGAGRVVAFRTGRFDGGIASR